MTQVDDARKRKARSAVALRPRLWRARHSTCIGIILRLAVALSMMRPISLWSVVGIGSMSRTLIIIGLLIVAVGVLWPWLQRLGLGRLPGDVTIQRDGFTFYAPIVTCILVSIVVSAVLWFLKR